MKDAALILVGAGGHALSLAEFASHLVCGYIANEKNPLMPGKWLGKDHEFLDSQQEMHSPGINDNSGNAHIFHISFVYSGRPTMQPRRLIIESYEKAGKRFVSLIAPSATVTPNSSLGDGCAVMAGAIINRAVLGRHVIVNSGAIVEHDCVVGDNTFIGPGAVIGGFTTIGSNCFIGLGTKIANGLKINDNITVGMGAVVDHDLTEPGIYHGNPLRCFKINVDHENNC